MREWEPTIRELAAQEWARLQAGESGRSPKFNYRAEHVELVFQIGIDIGERLDADMEILRAALLLHDIGRGAASKDHGVVGARMAAEMLHQTGFPAEKIAAVEYAIEAHVGWDESVPKTLEARILWDADKLTKLGATGILHRTMAGVQGGKDTWQAVADLSAWLETATYITDHMKTEPGSAVAEQRLALMKDYVSALRREIEPPARA